MRIRRIDPLSLGKVLGAVYGLIGLVFGGLFAVLSLVGGLGGLAFGGGGEGAAGRVAGLFFGVGSVVFLPLFYGVFGFLSGLLTAFVYNLTVRWTGGLVLETDPS